MKGVFQPDLGIQKKLEEATSRLFWQNRRLAVHSRWKKQKTQRSLKNLFNVTHKMFCLHTSVNCLAQLLFIVDEDVSCSRQLMISPKISHSSCLMFPLPRFLTSQTYVLMHLRVKKNIQNMKMACATVSQSIGKCTGSVSAQLLLNPNPFNYQT